MIILARFGLFILAAILIFFARRLHRKANGKAEKKQKIVATITGFIGGLALIGTFVGAWMAKVSVASPYVAAALFLGSALGLFFDWWTDKKPDTLAFICAVALPLTVVYGLSQLSGVSQQIGSSYNQVSSTISQQSGK